MKDGHVHSHYCLHGSDDTFQMYIENAIKAGIDEISFTEHFPLPRRFEDPSPQKDSSMDVEELEKYIKELQIVKKFYSGVIKINIGVEVDYIEGFEEEIKELLNKYGKDFEDSILSVHMVKYNSKYYCIDYDKDSFGELVDILGGVDKVYDLYYDTLKKAINSDLGMYKPKRIGHLNLVRKYNKIFPYDYENNEKLEEVVKLIKEKGYEVLYFLDERDEFVANTLMNYAEKPFQSVNKGDLDLESDEEKKTREEKAEANKDLLTTMKDSLGDKVKEVRLSSRLTDEAACVVADEGMSLEMEKYLANDPMAKVQGMKAVKILELNPEHPIFEKLQKLEKEDPDTLKKYTSVLYDQSLLAQGLSIDDPKEYAKSITELMMK